MTPGIQLSEDQQRVVGATDDAITLVAGAGSGKTEVVARRVERLLLESPDDEFRILALTYTVKAADELRDRFAKRLGVLGRRVDADTLHGFSHRLLRLHGTRIGLPPEPEVLVNDDDRFELLARWLRAEGQSPPPDARNAFAALDLARARCQDTELLSIWTAALDDSGAVDYPGMLTKATELLSVPAIKHQMTRLYAHVVVDEAQNLTLAQYSLLQALICDERRRLVIPTMVVGDEKQSIVSFAGADPELISRFASEFDAKRFKLRHNFRSARCVIQMNAAIARDITEEWSPAEDQDLDFPAPGRIDVRHAADEAAEASVVARWVGWLLDQGMPSSALAPGEDSAVLASEIAVLCRTGPGLRPAEAAVREAGYPTAMAALPSEWAASPGARLLLSMIAFHVAPEHQSARWALAKTLNCPESALDAGQGLFEVLLSHPDPRYAALAELARLEDPAGLLPALRQIPMVGTDAELADWEADVAQLGAAWDRHCEDSVAADRTWGGFRLTVLRMQRGDDLADGVRLLTVHKAQGREFKAVAVIGCNDGQMPHYRARTPEDLKAELRTFYVAVSRSSRVLLLTRARSRQTRFGARATEPSPYLGYVPADVDGTSRAS